MPLPPAPTSQNVATITFLQQGCDSGRGTGAPVWCVVLTQAKVDEARVVFNNRDRPRADSRHSPSRCSTITDRCSVAQTKGQYIKEEAVLWAVRTFGTDRNAAISKCLSITNTMETNRGRVQRTQTWQRNASCNNAVSKKHRAVRGNSPVPVCG